MRICVTGFAHPFGEGQNYGAEREIWYLIQELKKMGHECVVVSVQGTKVPGFEFHPVLKCWDDNVDIYWDVIKTLEPFDIIHSYQQGGNISNEMRSKHYCLEPFALFHRWQENVISYSKIHAKANGGKSSYIYFGIPDEPYQTIEENPDDYLVWIGRMDMGKAPDLAIEVAKRAGKRIILMGPAYHYPYFVDKIWPLIDDDQVIWLRSVDDEIKQRVFRKAKGFLSTNWDNYGEMFGIVNIESLAAGCPVIGWGCSSNPSAMNYQGGEIIKHGEQGFINEFSNWSIEERERTINQGVEYVKQLDNIDRHKCHELFINRFTARIMAEKHLKYYDIIRERGKVFDVTSEL